MKKFRNWEPMDFIAWSLIIILAVLYIMLFNETEHA